MNILRDGFEDEKPPPRRYRRGFSFKTLFRPDCFFYHEHLTVNCHSFCNDFKLLCAVIVVKKLEISGWIPLADNVEFQYSVTGYLLCHLSSLRDILVNKIL
jgi:hypothetical protein